MFELFFAFGFVMLMVAGMAIGVVMGRPPLKGSCGGVGKALGESDYICEVCGDDPAKCDEKNDSTATPVEDSTFYDATQK